MKPARHIMIGLALVFAVAGSAQAQYTRGDLNCDGSINTLDIDPFVLALTSTPPSYPEYYAQYPDCDAMLADIDCDSNIISIDIDSFVRCLTGGCPPCSWPPKKKRVPIPAGEFEMGDPLSEWDDDELPVHDVYVSLFFMDAYEVTNEKYCAYLNSAYGQGLIEVTSGVVYQADDSEAYCDTTTSSSDSRIIWTGSSFEITPGKEDHPMVRVSWHGAVAYSNWRSDQEGRTPCYDLETWECNFSVAGYRLPTEAEWEKAAGWDPVRQRHYRFGEHTDGGGAHLLDGHRANYFDSGDPFETEDFLWTTPVGYYDGTNQGGYQTEDARSYYGCYDMSGNVYEWCHDWYDEDYYSSSPYDNPQGPASGTIRILRGGHWIDFAGYCRSADRSGITPDIRDRSIGFRCALGTP